MRIDIATLFPEMCGAVLSESVLGRGIRNGHIEIYTHDIRDYTENKHRRVDDKPYGGGTGMVMQAQPVYDCVTAIAAQHKSRPRIIYMSPQGERLDQNKVKELAAEQGLILICGHYEGIDRRVLDELQCEELSVGDYVLTGGELPALIVADAVARLQRGVLPNEEAFSIESHYNGLLEYPQYSTPEVWRGRKVPGVLLSGDHKKVRLWQEKMSVEVTAQKRPDMLKEYINRCIRDIWEAYLREKRPDVPEDETPGIYAADSGSLKLMRRGALRELPDDGYKSGEHVLITDEQGIPRIVARIIRTGNGIAVFKTVYKQRSEDND